MMEEIGKTKMYHLADKSNSIHVMDHKENYISSAEGARKCHKCGHEDGDGVNRCHDMNPDSFIKGDVRSIMEETGWCFSCAFWESIYRKNKDNPNWVIIEGQSWIAHPIKVDYNRNYPIFVGCGGKWMTAKKENGEIVRTNNWWHQGNIPECFRDVIPDNAKWM